MSQAPAEFVLTLSCRDTKGIVHAVSGLLFEAGCNIIDSRQFGDVQRGDAGGLFFMRVHFEAPSPIADVAALLARAVVKWHTDHRVLRNGHRTVVFR